MKIHVKSYDDLLELKRNRKIFLFPSNNEIILNIPGLDEKLKGEWQNNLNQTYFNCGCESGSIFGFLSLIGYLIYCIVFLKFKMILLLIGLAIYIFCAFIGKIIGIICARYKFNRHILKLSHKLKFTEELN